MHGCGEAFEWKSLVVHVSEQWRKGGGAHRELV